MNKRGQIYIIAALIISVAIFLLISQTNFVQRILIEDDFEQLSNNFDVESAKFMNILLAEEGLSINITKQKFKAFTDEFSNYAQVENPNFEFIYILNYGGDTIFGNYMLEDLDVGGEEEPIEGVGCTNVGQTMPGAGGYTGCIRKRAKDVDNVISVSLLPKDIQIRGMQYLLDVQEGPQIIIISREEKGEQIKVYLNEEFVEGELI